MNPTISKYMRERKNERNHMKNTKYNAELANERVLRELPSSASCANCRAARKRATPGQQAVKTLWPDVSNIPGVAEMPDWGSKTAIGLAASIDNIINRHAGMNLAAATAMLAALEISLGNVESLCQTNPDAFTVWRDTLRAAIQSAKGKGEL